MSDGHCYSMFLFIFLFLPLLPICCSGTQPKPTSGPFNSFIVSVKDCCNPRRPYMKNPPIILNLSVQNINGKNMLGGNLTVLREVKDMKIKLTCYNWCNGRWRQAHSFNNLNCHGTMIHFTLAATGVKYDRNTCMCQKGFYIFQNMNVNKLQHIWASNMPYGRLLWRVEVSYKDGLAICKEFDTITEPAG